MKSFSRWSRRALFLMPSAPRDDRKIWDAARSVSQGGTHDASIVSRIIRRSHGFCCRASLGEIARQGTTGPVIRDSNVGYIDPAIPAELFRFRYDAAYDNNRPTRAEFFWSPGEPFGAGPIFQSVASIIRICCFTTSTLLIRNCRHLWNCRCDF